MKRIGTYLCMLFLGLTFCGLLVLRHAYRTAPLTPPISDLPTPPRQNLQPMDQRQGSLQLDPRTDYAADQAATKRLRKKLRHEELRQRPWEGRN